MRRRRDRRGGRRRPIPDGGGPFEHVVFALAWIAGERSQRDEVFDEADADRAVERFEALCESAAAEKQA